MAITLRPTGLRNSPAFAIWPTGRCSRTASTSTGTKEKPTMNNDQDAIRRFLPAGTKVRYDGLTEGGPEFGVVVHCWTSEEIGGYDCYVAFFGKMSFHAATLRGSRMS
jgi:hypothetical protein